MPPHIRRGHARLTHGQCRQVKAAHLGGRELMAAFASKANECEFCIKAHTAVSARAYALAYYFL